MFVIDANTLYVQNLQFVLVKFCCQHLEQTSHNKPEHRSGNKNNNSKVHSCSQKDNISSHITPWALMRFAWIHIPVQCSDFSTLEGRRVVYYDWPEFRDHTCFVTTVQHYQERDSWRKGLSFYYSCRNSNKPSHSSRIHYHRFFYSVNTHLKKKKKQPNSSTSCRYWVVIAQIKEFIKEFHTATRSVKALYTIEMNGLCMACESLAAAVTLTRLTRVKQQPDVERVCSGWVQEGRRWEWRVTAQHNPPSFQPLMRNPILRNWAPVGRKRDEMKALNGRVMDTTTRAKMKP